MRQNSKKVSEINKEAVELARRLKYAGLHKINFYTPTMSPAPKNFEGNEIESLEKGLEYFKEYSEVIGGHIVLQKKYMGSYCAIYFERNHDETKFVTRNGFTIRRNEEIMSQLKEKSQWMHDILFSDETTDNVIVETELTPWSFLGAGLIEGEYGRYGDVYREKIEYFKNNPELVERINRLKTHYQSRDKTQVPSHERRQIEALDKTTKLTSITNDDLELYLTQVKTFGREEEIKFNPFNILKRGFYDIDGVYTEELMEYQDNSLTEKSDYIIISFDDNDYLEQAKEFQAKHSGIDCEGIVIKPRKQGVLGIVPSFKVRNNNYLQLIYGVDFNSNYEEYLKARHTKQKMRLSIEDYEAARMLLRIPRKDITSEHEEFRHLFSVLVNGEEVLKTLDKKL